MERTGEAVVEVLARISRQAGALVRERQGRAKVEKKGAIDLVTDADRASEALIVEALSKELPNARIVAEEGGESGAHGELRIYVDPIDGTTNYASGMPHYAVTLAAADASGLLAGVVFDPERDELYRAVRGAGAYCNDERLVMRTNVRLDDAVLATGFPYDIRTRQDDVLGLFGEFVLKARAVRRFGSAALDLAWTAQGRYDGYFERGLKPWDMAAGVLLVQEAGGVCVGYSGGEFDLESTECVAGSAPLVREMVGLTKRLANG